MSSRAVLRTKAMTELRDQWNSRARAISEVSDERLAAALSVRDPGLARRISGTRRLQRRVHRSIEAVVQAHEAQEQAGAPSSVTPDVVPLDPAILNMDPALAQPMVEEDDTHPYVAALLDNDLVITAVRFAALAIHLRQIGGVVSKEEYRAMVEAHGVDAVAFAFAERIHAPDPGESGQEDGGLHWGASCIATWAASKKLAGADRLMPALVEFDPVPFDNPISHKSAAYLGEQAALAAMNSVKDPAAIREVA